MVTFQLAGSARRRQFCASLSLAALAPRAWAQEYPVKPIRLIIPFLGALTVTSAQAQRVPRISQHGRIRPLVWPGGTTGNAVGGGAAHLYRSRQSAQQPRRARRLIGLGSTPGADTSEHFAATIRSESQRWGKLIRALDLRAE